MRSCGGDAGPVGLLDRHGVEHPHRARGIDERLGAAGVVGREVAVRAVGLAQMVQQADSAVGVVRDLLEDIGDRIDADVGVLVDEMHGDEGIEDRDVDLLAPDRRDDGVAQVGVER